MTLQQLKYVDAVATCGSISEAARRVFATQPTLTESIRALEEELKNAREMPPAAPPATEKSSLRKLAKRVIKGKYDQ